MTPAAKIVLIFTMIGVLLLSVIGGSCNQTTATTTTAAPLPTWESIMNQSIKDADEALAKSRAERRTATSAGTPVELSDDWTRVTDDDDEASEQ
jgi:hypothetical protein